MFIQGITKQLGSLNQGQVFLATATAQLTQQSLFIKLGPLSPSGLQQPAPGIVVAADVVNGNVWTFHDTDMVTI